MLNLKASFILVLMLSISCISSNSSDDDEDSEATISDDQFEANYVRTSDDQVEHSETLSDDQVEVIDVSSSDDQEEHNISHSNDEEGPYSRSKCIDNIHKIFTKGVDPINHIIKAIDEMILYGEHRYEYEDHVAMYYYALQFFVNVDFIKDTKDFTTKKKILKSEKKAEYEYNEQFHMEIQLFEDKLSYYNILPKFSPTDLQQLDNLMGYPYNFSGVTTSLSGSSKQAVQLTIFKNALFYHKSGNYGCNDNVNEDTIKYFHKTRTYGWLYMRHIKRSIQLITTKMDTPEDFCEKLYPD